MKTFLNYCFWTNGDWYL